MTQFLANTFFTAAIAIVVGLGFGIVYQLCRYFHFAHGAILVVGAYTNWTLHETFSLPLQVSVPCAILVSAGLGWIIEVTAYRPLRRRRASTISFLLASLGAYTAIIAAVSLTFGDQTKTLRRNPISHVLTVFGARITGVQIATIGVALLLVVATLVLTRFSMMGKNFRAASDDPMLAQAVGIDVAALVATSSAVGAAIGGLAGVLISMDVDLRPTMAFSPLLLAVVAVIVGGVGNISGIALGALLVAFTRNLAAWYLGNEWGQTVTFALLVLFLVVRPRGFLGTGHRPILQD